MKKINFFCHKETIMWKINIMKNIPVSIDHILNCKQNKKNSLPSLESKLFKHILFQEIF